MRSVSQPERVVPTRSKTPMAASMPAAVTSGRPCSTEAGIRWTAIRPTVVAPHTAKLPASSQKSRTRAPSTSVAMANPNGFVRAAGRVVAHEDRHQQRHGHGDDAHHQHGGPPAGGLDDGGLLGQEDQLAGGR